MLFNLKDGWVCKDKDEAFLKWLPANNPNSGLWMFVDSMVLRNNGGASWTIFESMQRSDV
jgi:hypothetical protein